MFREEPGAKRPVLGPHAVRKHPLEGLQRVAAHGVEPLDFGHAQGLGPASVHVVRVQVRVEGPTGNDGQEGVSALAVSRVSSDLKLSSSELTPGESDAGT